jgi:thiamine-monophosphate kinase
MVRLSQVGEFGLIERISRRENKRPETIVGIGDDCAVLKLPTSNIKLQNKSERTKYIYQLITTDTLVENVDFKKKGLSFFHLGRKALAANTSDISAMGGIPTHALVTLGLPKNTDVSAIDELYRGIDSLAKKHKIDIIGGDTTDSAVMFITLVLLGEVEKVNLLLRSTARVGDLICVTGEFGGAAASNFKLPTSKLKTNVKIARKIAKSQTATAMIDSSDGLVRSVMDICRASKVGARLYEDAIPVADGATLDQALYGGEEYELVFTVKKGKMDRLLDGKIKYSVVGEVISPKLGVILIDKRGRIKPIKSGGYEHFKK